MRPMRLGLTGCVAGAALAALAWAGSARAAGPDVILGYGPFNFGMSVADAMKAAPKARLMRCNFPNHFKNCIDYDDKPYGLLATVRARFDAEQKLDAVYVQFDQLGGTPGSQACRKTATAVLGRLRDEYGPNWQPKVAGAAAPGRADAKGAAKTPPKDAAKAVRSKDAKTAPAKEAKSADTAMATDAATARQEPLVWFPVRGGKIGLIDLCAGDDTGVVYVVFTPSSIPGRKAS
jgi:hypothetical protein